MKFSVLVVFFMFIGVNLLVAQLKLPSVDIYTLNGTRVDANIICNDSVPMILVFFKTYDNDCRKNLSSINEAYENFLHERNIKVVAICVDGIGKINHVKPFVLGNDLDMEVYIDKNGNLKRMMGISDVPYTIIYDHNMAVYCQYNGYCTGIEEMICNKVMECINNILVKK